MLNAKPTSIRKKVSLLMSLVVLASILTISAFLVGYGVRNSINSKKSELQSIGYVYASAVASSLAADDRNQALSVLSSMARVPEVLFSMVINSDGHTMASLGNATFLTKDMITEQDNFLAIIKKGVLPVSVDIVKGGNVVGRLVLMADVSELRRQIFLMLLITTISALTAVIVGVTIAIPILGKITRPITELTKVMRHVREVGDYSTKVETAANDETGVLVDAFNAMLGEIDTRDHALEKLAYEDVLTEISNRHYFHVKIAEMISEHLADGGTATLFLLDLDDFKHINDAFGHKVGDALLITVVEYLKPLASNKIRIARLGGDEFVIVAFDMANEDEALSTLAQYIACFYKPLRVLDHELHVSTSVGIAMMPRDGNTLDEILRRAELALYSSKQRGQGNVSFFRPAMDAMVQEHTDIERGLRQALANNEFQTYFQPQIDLRTNKIYGFECLLRWTSARLGVVPPGVFIPIAENCGLIDSIGNWILRDGCATAVKWLHEGRAECEISVNVSPAQIMQADFLSMVKSILAETGLPPHLLCLELTESIFIGRSINKVQQMLTELKTLGLSLALDDFGTGYSSLSYLEKLPFDKIKIDRSFVSGIETDLTKRELLKGIIMLTHTLQREVVVEGAETTGEVALLRQLKADRVQGYAFAKPVAEADVVKTCQAVGTTLAAVERELMLENPGIIYAA